MSNRDYKNNGNYLRNNTTYSKLNSPTHTNVIPGSYLFGKYRLINDKYTNSTEPISLFNKIITDNNRRKDEISINSINKQFKNMTISELENTIKDLLNDSSAFNLPMNELKVILCNDYSYEPVLGDYTINQIKDKFQQLSYDSSKEILNKCSIKQIANFIQSFSNSSQKTQQVVKEKPVNEKILPKPVPVHHEKTNKKIQLESLNEDKLDYEDRFLCKICLENKINCVLIECGHLVTCISCSVNKLKACPLCCQRVRSIHKVYLP